MEAETVWRIWRRVLREPAIQQAMPGGPARLRAAVPGLDDTAVEVIGQYARTPAGTRFFIAGFRFRMRSSFVNALETAAPLTHRRLRASGIGIDALADEYLEATGWHDYGPYVYTFGGQILRYLMRQQRLAALAGLPELAALELAGVRVITAAARDAGPVELAGPRFSPASPVPAGTVHAIAWFETVHCPLDLGPWLREPATLGRVPPAARPRWFLVYLRPPALERRIVALPERAAAMMNLLRDPLPPARIAGALTQLGYPADPDADVALLSRLVQLKAVRRCPEGE